MPTEIVITAGDVKVDGFLADTPTGRALAEVLPFSGKAQLWGHEIYFPVPRVAQDLDETAATVVEAGDLGYWPPGKAFCIFFGYTPASLPGEIRPASAVNLVGRIYCDHKCLVEVPEGELVTVAQKE